MSDTARFVIESAGRIKSGAISQATSTPGEEPTGVAEQKRRKEALQQERKAQQQAQNIEKIKEDKIVYEPAFTGDGTDKLVIGDLVFSMPSKLSPPVAIRIDKEHINYRYYTLRTTSPQKISSGHSKNRISCTLYFVGQEAIAKGLVRLVATFNALPFVFINNSFIRSNLASGSLENIVCSLVSINVHTAPGLTDTLAADLDLLWFNYKPYAPNFWFKETWESAMQTPSSVATTHDDKSRKAEQVDIADEKYLDIVMPVNKRQPTVTYSTPTPDPARSKPLQQLVDRHIQKLASEHPGKTRGGLNGIITNDIAFTYKEYLEIRGVEPGKINTGSLNEELLKEPDSTYITPYNARLLFHPSMADAVSRLALKFYSKWGKYLGVTSGFRTREEQALLYHQKPEVATKPGSSWHEVGLAIDLAVSTLTKPQWEWLITEAAAENLSNLGHRNGYAPAFDSKGNPAPIAEPVEGKKASNWETWHFDYLPGQEEIHRQYGHISTPETIKARIVELYWGKEEPDKYQEEYNEAVGQRLGEAEGAGWQTDNTASSSSKIILFRNCLLEITEYDTELVPQAIAITKHNVIADLPIVGYEFSTQQYLGSTDMDAVIVFQAVGEVKLSRLQGIIDQTRKNARSCKEVRQSAAIAIDNSVFNIMGFDKALLEGISAESIPGQPGLYTVTLRLSEYKEPKRQLTQARYHPSYLWRDIARYVWKYVTIDRERLALSWEYTLNKYIQENYGISGYIRSNYGAALSSFGFRSAGGSHFDVSQALRLQQYTRENKLEDEVWNSKHIKGCLVFYWVPAHVRHLIGGGLLPPNPTTGEMPVVSWFTLSDNRIVEPLMEFVTIYAQLVCPFASTLHTDLLQELGIEDPTILEIAKRGRINDIANNPKSFLDPLVQPVLDTLSGGNYYPPPTPEEKMLQKKFINKLKVTTSKLIDGGAIFEPFFNELRKEILPDIERYTRGQPCYPDLDLPANPMTHSQFDTPPDYWFYNESIDGAMFPKQELLNESLSRMRLAYQSMLGDDQKPGMMTREDWDKYYISYNKPDIDSREKNRINAEEDDAETVSAFAATILPGEDGLPDKKEGYAIAPEDLKKKLSYSAVSLTGKGTQNKLKYPHNSFANVTEKINFGQTKGAPFDVDVENEYESDSMYVNHGGRRLEKMITASFVNFDQKIFNLARAYPTFKIYFIEDDSHEADRIGYRNFDDFYSYSAIQDIRIVRSRKIPADLCVITMTNIFGDLDTLAFTNPKNKGTASDVITEKFDPATVNTEQENPFSKLVLVEGSKIKVQLGYDNDPDRLETVFIGQVVEIGTSAAGVDLIQIVCQSYAAELVAEEKTLKSGFGATQELLSTMMCSPEVTNFGRWSRTGNYDPAEIRTSRSGGANVTAIGDLINKGRDTVLRTWQFLNKPQDDNVFAPGLDSYSDLWEKMKGRLSYYLIGEPLKWLGIIEDKRVYYANKVTIWDIFQEMELRHPGFVSLAVPYGNRMTMFFGPPDHRYWSRPLTVLEEEGWTKLKDTLGKIYTSRRPLSNTAKVVLPQGFLTSFLATTLVNTSSLASKSLERTEAEYAKYIEWITKTRLERYKPFRNYFLLSSQHNIVANNITASSHGTYNAVELTYCDSEIDPTEPLEHILEDAETLEMKADDNIEDKDTRVMRALYTSCCGNFFARRYAVSLLMRSLRDVYKGEIIVTGDPKIKPYDVCVLYDDYRDMYGPIEVEQVTHIFSKETGFITEIKPDMIVNHNNFTTMGTLEAMMETTNGIYKEIADKYPATGLAVGGTAAGLVAGTAIAGGIVAGGVGLGLMLWGGYKLIQCSQARQPIIITPLTIGYKPLVAGLTGYQRDTVIANLRGAWHRFTTDVKQGWDEMVETGAVKTWFLERVAGFTE